MPSSAGGRLPANESTCWSSSPCKTSSVAAVQMNAPLGEVERNRAEVVRWARLAAERGAQLVCFPELVITGHWCAGESWGVAEEVPGGPTTRALMEVARDLGVVIAFGIGERGERGGLQHLRGGGADRLPGQAAEAARLRRRVLLLPRRHRHPDHRHRPLPPWASAFATTACSPRWRVSPR